MLNGRCVQKDHDCKVLDNEYGHSLLELVAGLALLSLLFAILLPILKHITFKVHSMQKTVEVLNSVIQAKSIIKHDLSELFFTPICPEMLPSERSMILGEGVSESIRGELARKVVISKPPLTQQQSLLDFNAPQGRGTMHYSPKPVKNISGLVEGAHIILIRGLQLLEAKIHGTSIIGRIPERYKGLKELAFYLTDCKRSLFIMGKFVDNGIIIEDSDRQKIATLFKSGAQIYLFREQLIYLQKNGDKPVLVIDYLDGQAFVRIENIYDFRVNQRQDKKFNALLVVGIPALSKEEKVNYIDGDYQRELVNVLYVDSFSFSILD